MQTTGERKRVREKHLDVGERTPLLSSTENYSSVNIETNENQPQDTAGRATSKHAGESDAETSFSFRQLPARKKWTLCMMAFSNFAACTCFSLLAPFFPIEVKRNHFEIKTLFYFLFLAQCKHVGMKMHML